jgi:DNA helicase-2/ATP-dependent DNA helicase PcrA
VPPAAFERKQELVAVPRGPARLFSTGEKVFHPKFGEGQIASVVDRSGDQEIAVEFTRHGLKRLLGSLANLEPLS